MFPSRPSAPPPSLPPSNPTNNPGFGDFEKKACSSKSGRCGGRGGRGGLSPLSRYRTIKSAANKYAVRSKQWRQLSALLVSPSLSHTHHIQIHPPRPTQHHSGLEQPQTTLAAAAAATAKVLHLLHLQQPSSRRAIPSKATAGHHCQLGRIRSPPTCLSSLPLQIYLAVYCRPLSATTVIAYLHPIFQKKKHQDDLDF